ncbi:hypothetical protein IJ00_17390 [Calothrix sp. 336/3]|nr:hypothetical protein IJ00_17390 [Calothrix sp. 336/3]
MAASAERSSIATHAQHRLTFAEYMEIALYHPEYGYYSTQAANLGKKGDFFTSVHLGADFGEMLAEQFQQMWLILGKPQEFQLVEMGAGQGILAQDILKYLQKIYPDFFAALKYSIVEKSPTLRSIQQQRLQEFAVNWYNLEEISPNSVTGCFFSNELVDAFPVHQFTVVNGELQEIYVTVSSDSLQEITDKPSTPKLLEYLQMLGIEINSYADGYRSEINLSALDWLGIVANRLHRGYVLTIDYGYSASRYYNPRRNQGTLQCYWQHQRHNNPYIHIGHQDITTHVDFTALERWGEQCGLDKVGFVPQEIFLMALGLGERIASLSQQKLPIVELLQRRDCLHQLIDPMGVGGFGVLAQSKGLNPQETSQPLKGFNIPELA